MVNLWPVWRPKLRARTCNENNKNCGSISAFGKRIARQLAVLSEIVERKSDMARDQMHFNEFMQQFQLQLAAAGNYSLADWMREHLPELAGPAITTFNPVCGAPGAMITVRGMHFSPVCEENAVLVGSKPAIVIVASRTELKVITAYGVSDGPVMVTVGGRTASGPVDFNVIEAMPEVASRVDRQIAHSERRALDCVALGGISPQQNALECDDQDFDWQPVNRLLARRATDAGRLGMAARAG